MTYSYPNNKNNKNKNEKVLNDNLYLREIVQKAPINKQTVMVNLHIE